ncbi:MAG: GspH/FimT family pseudopilin [Burkholderiaceae bacterium]|nr:GspH/FimT family pseudopilin [Burkholderiaceae bacterium]
MDSLQHTSPADRVPTGLGTTTSVLHRQRQRGFTLIEAALTLVILALLAGAAAPGFRGLIDRQRLAGVAAQLATDVQFARSESVLRNEPLRLSLYSAAWGSCYVVHSGARSQCSCALASATASCVGDAVPVRTVVLPASDGLGVQANVTSIGFDPLHGTSTPTGTLRVVSPRAGSIHHVVNLLGRVRSCSPGVPGPAVPGYRAC